MKDKSVVLIREKVGKLKDWVQEVLTDKFI
jgi:hypothetical protein